MDAGRYHRAYCHGRHPCRRGDAPPGTAAIDHADEKLVQAIGARSAEAPILKEEAVALLRGCGLTNKAARTLLERGGNRRSILRDNGSFGLSQGTAPAKRWGYTPLVMRTRRKVQR